MGRLKNKRNVVHYYFWATWFRGLAGVFAPDNPPVDGSELFAAAPANISIGNKFNAGIFPDNNVFKLLSLRCFLLFYRMASAGASTMVGIVDDLTCMMLAQSNLFYTLRMSQKDMFQAPAYFMPAGGGVDGDLGTLTTPFLTNGQPTARAVSQFVKPIIVSPQQLATVRCNHIAVGAGNLLTDIANSNAGIAINSIGMEGIFVRAAL